MFETSEQVNAFEFSGERLCLDFANTLSERETASPVELLHTYADLLHWCQRAGSLNEQEIARLQAQVRRRPGEAERELLSIRQAREVLFNIFRARASEQVVQGEDLQQFNALLGETMRHARLEPGVSGFAWDWSSEGDQLALPLWYIVRDAANLLTSPELTRVRICASSDCNWLFLDSSKNRSRRWCDMKSCGNRAKARRHYGRKKEENK